MKDQTKYTSFGFELENQENTQINISDAIMHCAVECFLGKHKILVMIIEL